MTTASLRARLERLIAATDADGAGLASDLERLRRHPPVPEAPGSLAARIAEMQAHHPTAPVLGMLRNRARASVRFPDTAA